MRAAATRPGRGPARPHRHGETPRPAPPGHNHADGDHLHSHPLGPEDHAREAVAALAASFVEGFRAAADKPSFLRLAGIPAAVSGRDGEALHLVEATIVSAWQLGTASPGFGTRALSYLPYPAGMVGERETMRFTYVSLDERRDLDLVTLLLERVDAEA